VSLTAICCGQTTRLRLQVSTFLNAANNLAYLVMDYRAKANVSRLTTSIAWTTAPRRTSVGGVIRRPSIHYDGCIVTVCAVTRRPNPPPRQVTSASDLQKMDRDNNGTVGRPPSPPSPF
jgi:hypothetical protein